MDEFFGSQATGGTTEVLFSFFFYGIRTYCNFMSISRAVGLKHLQRLEH